MAGKKDPKESKSSPDRIDTDQNTPAIDWSKVFRAHTDELGGLGSQRHRWGEDA